MKDPEHASTVGYQAGQQAVMGLRMYFLLGAAVLSIIGAWLGVLPGTRSTRTNEKSP
ncbi:MAG TPA: hypothetical protein VHU84_06035 [Lacipirellulaceae bacterium]|nr:hypothetical protein [Lacipirellulaceae bacterium]